MMVAVSMISSHSFSLSPSLPLCLSLSAVKEWRGEEVGVWLKQLSPTLYEFYFSCFSKHDITGERTLPGHIASPALAL